MTKQEKTLSDSLEYHKSIDISDMNVPYSVTLRTWEGTKRPTLRSDDTHFLNQLDLKVFGNAYKKYGKRLQRVGVIEGREDCLHDHLVLKSPHYMNEIEFKTLGESVWKSVRCGQTYKMTSSGQSVPQFDM